jgi:ATP-dependent Clp protease ATP-binding subunit ClpC
MLVPLPRVKRVMELAFEEAKRMNNSNVGTESLLLGLLIDAENTAAKVLAGLNVTEEKVRAEIADFIERNKNG